MKKTFDILKEVHYELHGNAHKYRHHYAYVNGSEEGGSSFFLK